MTYDEFQAKFWKLWYRDQTSEEIERGWLPSKRPAQVALEFVQYLWIVSAIKAPTVLEIGVKDGHTWRFYDELLDCFSYVGIDITPCPGIDVEVDILGDSKDPEVIAAAQRALGHIDILFIDGDHSRAGVLADYMNYRGMVTPGGFIAMHDTHHDHAEYCDGASKLWPVVQKDYDRNWDIYHETNATPCASGTKNHKQCGIGLIQVI